MKSKQNDLYFCITAILFSVCCCAFKSLRAGAWYGKRFFIVQTAVSLISIGIGLLCAGGFVIRLLRKRRVTVWAVCACIMGLMITPVMVYQTIPNCKDLMQGEVVHESEIFDIVLPDSAVLSEGPKHINLYYKNYYRLQLPDEAYETITAESPLDLTRRVWNEPYGEDKAPHLHPIRISFYEYTGIFDQVEILYD